MERRLVEIRYNFDLTIKVEGLEFDEMMLLCNAFDAYEITERSKDLAVVDVLGFDEDNIQLKVTLKQSLTYVEIAAYIRDLMTFAKLQVGKNIELKPQKVRYNLRTFGAQSDIFDERVLENSPMRERILKQYNIKVKKEEKGPKTYKKIELGRLYLIEEAEHDRSYKLFKDIIAHGYSGLCISRSQPAKIRAQYGLENASLIWLTRNSAPGKPWIVPTELSKIYIMISEFIEKSGRGIALIDGLEYLITQNSFVSVLKLVQSLNDKIMLTSGLCLISINPQALSHAEYALLERECKRLKV